jgi:endoglycosylceramidase
MPLTHNGRWLTAADRRVVIFHGINLAEKVPPYTVQTQGFTEQDAAMLAREGFSSVRLGIFYAGLEPSPGVFDDTQLAADVQLIGWLYKYGITTRVNFQQELYANMFGGVGFPDWSADTDGVAPGDYDVGGPYPLNLIEDGLLSPAVKNTWDNLYANTAYPDSVGLEDRYAQAWIHVVNYLKNTPGLIAYDMLNEPSTGNIPPGAAEQTQINPFYKTIVAAIRSVDPVHQLDYEPFVLDAVGVGTSGVSAGSDPNKSLTFHFYPATDDGLAQTAPASILLEIANADANEDAVELTEFGATDDLTQIQDIVNACDAELTPWLYWAFWAEEPLGNPATPNSLPAVPAEGIVYDPTQPPVESNLQAAKLDVLDRPYPFLISGTPTAWNLNTSTNVFTLSYSTAPVSGGSPLSDPTVVIVPVRLYPSGYTASVTGATVTSQPNSNALTLAADSGATTVSLTVTPNASAASSSRKR